MSREPDLKAMVPYAHRWSVASLLRQEGIGFSGRSLRIAFPNRYLKSIKYAEIEQAIERLIAAAEKLRARK